MKKLLALVLAAAMVLAMVPMTAMAAAPDMSGTIVNVDASNAQDVLDGKYGSIDGKTINFTESISSVLEFGRPMNPTDYPGNGTTIEAGNNHFRTVKNVTLTADAGVTLAGFTYDAVTLTYMTFDPVLGAVLGGGHASHKHITLENITFDGLTITGHIKMMLYSDKATVEGITVRDCVFTGTTDDGSNAAVKMLADNRYFTDVTVEGCTIKDYFQGVYIQAPDGAEIASNAISNTTHNAVALQSHSVPAKGALVIKENYIENAQDRAIRLNVLDGSATLTVNNNIMVNSADADGEAIKATTVPAGVTVNLENNYWNGASVDTAVVGLTKPTAVGVVDGTFPVDVTDYMAQGYYRIDNGDGTYTVSDTQPTPAPTPIPEEAPIPETGDGMGLFVFAGLALVSMLGMAAMKKREQN